MFKNLIPRLFIIPTMLMFLGGYVVAGDSVEQSKATWVGGDFTLIDHSNHPWSLKSARGKVVLLFFGYTHCSHVCTLGLITLAGVMRQLDEKLQQRVQPLFITLDPEQDTPEALRNYVGYFHPSIIGLTGHQETINRIAKHYGVFSQRRPSADGGNDTLDHSASFFIVAPDGQLATIVPFGLPAEHIVQVIGSLLDSSELKR